MSVRETPLIITAALVGAETMRDQTPYVPYTPEEIAQEAARCAAQGAHVMHVHGRQDDGTPTQSKAVFERILGGIRQRCETIVQFSTGGAVGMGVEERIEGLELRPEMATLTTGSVNFGEGIFENSMPTIRTIARRLKEHGIRPEVEVFEVGMLETAWRLVKEGLLEASFHVDFVLGVPGAMGASVRGLEFLVESLPPSGVTWCVAGVGRHELPMAREAIRRGGHVRVGLEDNVYLSKGVLAKGSWELVQAVVEMAKEEGRPLATMAQARDILRL